MRNRFWRNTRTEKHRPDDPLDTNLPTPPAPPPVRTRNCTCEFCGCLLTPTGEIIKMGEVAKSVRKHDEQIEKKDKEIGRLTEELAEARKKIETLTQGSGSASSSHRPGSRVA